MIRIELPQEIADELVANQLAIRPGTRSSTAQILVVGASSVATVISLLQAPDTFAKLAAMIKNRFGKKEGVTLKVKGKRGIIELDLTDQTDVENLAKMIREGLVGDFESGR
jgi:hypothetical protein